MKYKICKLVMGLFVCIVVMLVFNMTVHADSANISVSSTNGSEGDIVYVKVQITLDVDGGATIWISYDGGLLDYVTGTAVGTDGVLTESLYDLKAGVTKEIELGFKLKKPGTATVAVEKEDIHPLSNPEEVISNINKTNGTVTINATTTASNDSHLSGLNVQAVSQNGDSTAVIYTPSFSPDIYEYRADLPSTTARLVVSTTLSDTNATTKVSGTRIDPGNNKTTITVVAEDGSQSQYIIYTTRPSESTTEPTTESESSSEETTAFDRSPKEIKSLNKYLIQDFSLITIPEGFEEGTATYEDKTIAVLKGIAKELTLVCLADDAEGTNAEIYIFNEASGAMDKMINITSSQKMYTIIPTDDSYAGPEGYAQTNLEINGVSIKAWIKEEGAEFYVVYAMNWNGEKALYVYDTKEQSMQRFVEGNKSQTFEDEPEEENKEYLAMKKKYDDMYKEYVKDHSKKNKTIIALLVVIVAAVIGFIIILSKRKGSRSMVHEEDMEEIGGEMHRKELNLDMVAQPDRTKVAELSEELLETEETEYIEEAFETEETGEIEYVEETNSDNEVIYDDNKTLDEGVSAENKEQYEDKEQAEDTYTNSDEKKDDGVLIDMEEEEPFEIEFFDLDDDNK